MAIRPISWEKTVDLNLYIIELNVGRLVPRKRRYTVIAHDYSLARLLLEQKTGVNIQLNPGTIIHQEPVKDGVVYCDF